MKEKVRNHLWPIICFILISLVTSNGYCQSPVQLKILKTVKPEEVIPSHSDRFLTIRPEKNVYIPGEGIWIEVIITNTSEDDMNPYGYLHFVAVNNITKEIYSFDERELDKEGYIREILWIDQILRPSESISRKINLADFINNHSKGEYKITFSFMPWEDNNTLIRTKPAFLSNTITIIIDEGYYGDRGIEIREETYVNMVSPPLIKDQIDTIKKQDSSLHDTALPTKTISVLSQKPVGMSKKPGKISLKMQINTIDKPLPQLSIQLSKDDKNISTQSISKTPDK